jgi:hypothetical protein
MRLPSLPTVMEKKELIMYEQIVNRWANAKTWNPCGSTGEYIYLSFYNDRRDIRSGMWGARGNTISTGGQLVMLPRSSAPAYILLPLWLHSSFPIINRLAMSN